MRLLYIHSFQSLIWNKMVSKRIQLFGMKPVEGDFILIKTEKEENEDSSSEIPDDDESISQLMWETKLYENHSVAVQDFFNLLQKFDKSITEQIPKSHKYKKRNEWVTKEIMDAINLKDKLYKQYNKDRDNKVLEREYKDLRNKITNMVRDTKKEYQLKKEKKEKAEEPFKCKQEIIALTADELSNYTIYDIVLPLPGYDINYPEHLKEYYKEALEEYGLTLEMTKQKVKTYTLCGNYRKILEKVKDVSWKIMHYNNPTENLIRSDFEELRGNSEPEDVESKVYFYFLFFFSKLHVISHG
ncbi:hypothetical protein NQ314_003350 [Rhamnusium bicolor]|uniref:TRUD domain-containing protein n=1 Tax=Rhamnusium bicolor TaxID=1586634 RepID=A0AAV8ZML9_9CUCU|nr:hypothetical protein NQ314_003350 [Rhamnusium bicolor]